MKLMKFYVRKHQMQMPQILTSYDCFVLHTGLYSQKAARLLEFLFSELQDPAILLSPAFGYCHRDIDGECCAILWSDDIHEAEDWLQRSVRKRCEDFLWLTTPNSRNSDVIKLAQMFIGYEPDENWLNEIKGRPWNPLKSSIVKTLLEELKKAKKDGDFELAAELKYKITSAVEKQ